MKKLIVLLVIILPISLKGQISIGPNIGANFSKIKSDIIIFDYSTGLNLGVKINSPIKENFIISVAPTYSEKGGKLEYNLTPGIQDFERFNLTYIDLPITVSPKLKVCCFEILPMVGINVGYLLDAVMSTPRIENQTIVYDEVDLLGDDVFPVGSKTNNISVGTILGLGTLIPVSNKMDFFIDFRYTYDFTGVFVLGPTVSKESKMSNSYFTISTGILFKRKLSGL